METILLVEDEPRLRQSTARLLLRAGFHVLQAVDGQQACSLFHQHSAEIDLILMDVIMPRMDGRAAYEEIVKVRNVPVIFCSGQSDRELGQDFLQHYGLELLPKPLRADELLSRVQRRLHPQAA